MGVYMKTWTTWIRIMKIRKTPKYDTSEFWSLIIKNYFGLGLMANIYEYET